MLSSHSLGRERKSLRGATQIQGIIPPLAFWYGKETVGVSAPAPPLSFVQSGRGALSAVPLSVGREIGVLLRHPRGYEQIVCVFCRNVKQ